MALTFALAVSMVDASFISVTADSLSKDTGRLNEASCIEVLYRCVLELPEKESFCGVLSGDCEDWILD